MITVTAIVRPYSRHEELGFKLEVIERETEKDILIALFELLSWSGDLNDDEREELNGHTVEELHAMFESSRFNDGGDEILAIVEGKVQFWNGYNL